MVSDELLKYIITGALFGLTAGISPGPLLALVISETLKHNKSGGIKVALAPLITDLPIIGLSFFVIYSLSNFNNVMGLISVCGSIFLMYLGYECFKTRGPETGISKHKQRSVIKGVIVNALNPHPYLFWITVGTPLALKAYQVSLAAVISYFVSFYVLLIGSKIIVAVLVDRTRSFISTGIYIWIMRFLGIALFTFAILFFSESIRIFRDHAG